MLHKLDCRRQPLPREYRTAEQEYGTCALLGGRADPCTAERPCPRVRCGVDEWGPEVRDALELYSRVITWQGQPVLAQAELEVGLGWLDTEERAQALWLLRTFHLEYTELLSMAEGSSSGGARTGPAAW